jgi:alcohol dehydrogenase, propanol-preferring
VQAAITSILKAPLVIAQIPTPEPAPGDVLVEVIACGLCHSDVHAIDGDWSPLPSLPLIPGHEVTGRIVELGDGAVGVAIGDLVGVPWLYSSCGVCESCIAGRANICPAMQSTGYSRAGGYADYVVAPATSVVRLPDGCDPYTIAPILCAGVTAYRAVTLTDAVAGQWIAVIGVGGLGHLAVQYARTLGCRVVAIDVDDTKLSLAALHGAEVTVNAAAVDASAEVARRCGGMHGVVVTATSTAAFESAVPLVRPGGTVVFVGMPGGDGDLARLSIGTLVSGEITVRGSSLGTRRDLEAALTLAASGEVVADVAVVGFDQLNDALDDLRFGRTTGRTVLRVR